MCGIVAGVSGSDISTVLLEGLMRLEYRGYDSAGVAFLNDGIQRVRRAGKVSELKAELAENPCHGRIGLAHTRWATHGVPDEANAHPHVSSERIVVVHNGIIENYEQLKKIQQAQGFVFESETDSEVIAHQIMLHLKEVDDILQATAQTCQDMEGAFALGILDRQSPDRLIAVRHGSPLVIGIDDNAHYISSDIRALLQKTRQFIYLKNGEIAEIKQTGVRLFDFSLNAKQYESVTVNMDDEVAELGTFKHYMHKEIYDQPRAIADTLEGRLFCNSVPDEILGVGAAAMLDQVEVVHIVACGTSYHAALVARYWFENLAGISCPVEVASEFRYCRKSTPKKALFVVISQSGETADTLAALELAKTRPYLARLAICNVAQSSIVQLADYVLMTHAGPEIGVASTKAFTSQLVVLLLLVVLLGKRGTINVAMQTELVEKIRHLPAQLEEILKLEPQVEALAEQCADKQHALFLGRGTHYPIALEGALKMKEITYIHAEAYPAGELKHGPLALVDHNMPVIAVAPNDELLAKLLSNLAEVRARGGILHVFADQHTQFTETMELATVIRIKISHPILAPIAFTLPLQLLAYHTARLRGTNIDQPRNLAKSVTVE